MFSITTPENKVWELYRRSFNKCARLGHARHLACATFGSLKNPTTFGCKPVYGTCMCIAKETHSLHLVRSTVAEIPYIAMYLCEKWFFTSEYPDLVECQVIHV